MGAGWRDFSERVLVQFGGLEESERSLRVFFLERLLVTGEEKLSSLLAHFSWRGAFQVCFCDHILVAVDFLDIVVTVL